MARGICASCGKQLGGFMGPKAWECPGCRKFYCDSCGPKVGLVFKKPTCPSCGRELAKA